jgi:FtsP/CotA-like multicopper oxidase with cupredoxin domain
LPGLSRRSLIRAAAGLSGAVAVGGLAACSTDAPVRSGARAVAAAESARRRRGQKVVTARLTPRPMTVDLGGRVVDTWGYGDSVPGPLLRATAGDLLRVEVDNQLPVETSVHWHGVALRNDMDGVPGITQDPIKSGATFSYEFTVPEPGTYFYHPHTGVQLDRGLHGVLLVDDPHERGDYDLEWVVLLDDWIDGTGRTPDEVLKELGSSSRTSSHDMGGMGGMPMGGDMGEGMHSPVLGGAGDVEYPYYLVNGRTPAAPTTLSGKPGQRVRVRFVNAGADTAFRVALGGHHMTVTHSDGFPVAPVRTDALMIGMGERFDVTVTLGDGAFPLIASAEGKNGHGLAVVRTGAGRAPSRDVGPAELSRQLLQGADLSAADLVQLPPRSVDRHHGMLLRGSMAPYRWTINGKTFADSEPLPVSEGERVRLRFTNMSMMFHPMHIHGHTFALVDGGARKDTVIVKPMQAVEVDFDANNPGQWAAHCHNIYHAETGMMTTLSYRA